MRTYLGRTAHAWLVTCLTFSVALPLAAQATSPSGVRLERLIADGRGGLPPDILEDGARFGWSVTSLGDLDGNGSDDIAVGSPRADVGEKGAVWILFLDQDQRVIDQREISARTTPALGLASRDDFGWALAAAELDGTPPLELVVGRPGRRANAASPPTGAIDFLFLDPLTWTVASSVQVSVATPGIANTTIGIYDRFGSDLAVLDDFNGHALTLAVGTEPVLLSLEGAFVVLELNWVAGAISVASANRFDATNLPGGTGSALRGDDRFGASLAYLGDIDGNGGTAGALVVGAPGSDEGGSCSSLPPSGLCQAGAVWIVFFQANGRLAHAVRFGPSTIPSGVMSGDFFGAALAWLPDPSGGPTGAAGTLAVGAPRSDDGGANTGGVHLLRWNVQPLGTTPQVLIGAATRISSDSGTFFGTLAPGDNLGAGLGSLGDLDGNGEADLALGAGFADHGGTDRGGLFIAHRGERFTPHLGCDTSGLPCTSAGLNCHNGNTLLYAGGTPRVGDTLDFAVLTPTHCDGSLIALFAGGLATPGFWTSGCGIPVNGWGWQWSNSPGGPRLPGELLLDPAAAKLAAAGIASQIGGGLLSVSIPANPALAGARLLLQAGALDRSNNACGLNGAPYYWSARSLTNMIEVHLGI